MKVLSTVMIVTGSVCALIASEHATHDRPQSTSNTALDADQAAWDELEEVFSDRITVLR